MVSTRSGRTVRRMSNQNNEKKVAEEVPSKQEETGEMETAPRKEAPAKTPQKKGILKQATPTSAPSKQATPSLKQATPSSKQATPTAKQATPIAEQATPIKNPPKRPAPVEMEEESSDDDAPMEISSKKTAGPDMKLVEDDVPEMSLFEQVQSRKKEEEERRKEKAKQRRVKRKKLDEGQYVVKAKKAEFKVSTLLDGIKKPLEPAYNFKAELLKSRTADRRVNGSIPISQRSKWVKKKKVGI